MTRPSLRSSAVPASAGPLSTARLLAGWIASPRRHRAGVFQPPISRMGTDGQTGRATNSTNGREARTQISPTDRADRRACFRVAWSYRPRLSALWEVRNTRTLPQSQVRVPLLPGPSRSTSSEASVLSTNTCFGDLEELSRTLGLQPNVAFCGLEDFICEHLQLGVAEGRLLYSLLL